MRTIFDKNSFDKDVRHFIYSNFSKTGQPPAFEKLAARFNTDSESIKASLDRLTAAHQIALAPGSYNIWMAHPFSAIPTDFVTRLREKKYHGN